MVDSNKLRGILIDARKKSITEVFVDPFPAWKKTIESDDINAVNLARYVDGHIETLWVDGEGLLNDKQNGPWFKMPQYNQPMAVIGIILGTDEAGETISTKWTVEEVEPMVTWPNVHFAGLEPIEPHTENHPLFGDVFVTGTVARFEDDTNNAGDRDEQEKKS